jgi:nucleotide-binding universal stress UspA family protein
MKILFPTAFSMYAKHYFQYAIEMAHRFNGDLIMMHTFPKSESRTSTKEKLQNRGELVIKQLKEFVAENIPPHYDINVSYHVKEAGPVNSILTTAKEKEIDLIVMGMKSKPEKGKGYIGEVTNEIMQRAVCPVLIVPPSAKFNYIDKLVYALDFDFRDLAVINELLYWCKILKAELKCVHILEQDEKPEISERNMGILNTTYNAVSPKVELEIVKGEVKEGIARYTQENEVDVLILAFRKRSILDRLFIPNTTKAIVKTVNTPILILKYE